MARKNIFTILAEKTDLPYRLDKIEELSNRIIEYNHFRLKGNII
ncbi:MAG: hypothetical protein ACLUVN_05825 [Frisingicoccus sp.]